MHCKQVLSSVWLAAQDAAQLSEDQILDLIHLWRMCSTRRGQLANARKTKLTQIPVESFSDVQMPDPRENVANLTEMANFIKENGTEDFKVYSDTMCAIYRGVSCLSCLFWTPQLSCLSCSGACHVYRANVATVSTLSSMTSCLSTFYKYKTCTTHLPT